MSYCRNNGENSNVYVIGTDSALECCGCRLYKYSYQTRRYSTMIEHLGRHCKSGDKVPAHALVRLQEEQLENKNIYPATNKRKLDKNVLKTNEELLHIKFYREMEYHRKEMARTAVEIFEHIYGRKPTQLEIPGVAKSVDIEMDLMFNRILGKS